MTNSRKRQRDDNDYQANFSDEDEEFMDKSGTTDEVQLQFEVNEPDFEHDYHGIELFCGMLLNGEKFLVDQLADAVLGDEQSKVANPLTSVIKVPHIDAFVVKNDEKQDIDWDYDMDMYGVTSLIDFHAHKKAPFYKSVYEYVLQAAGNDQNLKKTVQQVLQSKSIGLLINHHVYNLPYNVSFPMQYNLIEEYREEVKQKKIPYFDYILIITKVFVQREKDTQPRKQRAPQFLKQEDEYYYKVSDFSYQYILKSDSQYDETEAVLMQENGHREGMIMFVKTPNILKAAQEMQKLSGFQMN